MPSPDTSPSRPSRREVGPYTQVSVTGEFSIDDQLEGSSTIDSSEFGSKTHPALKRKEETLHTTLDQRLGGVGVSSAPVAPPIGQDKKLDIEG